jgi:hypothetical protein
MDEKKATYIKWISGDTPDTALYQITDAQGRSTVITADRLSELTFEVMEEHGEDAIGGEAALSERFRKEIRGHGE